MEHPMSMSTFDVFDTAITRLWFRPTDLFLPVGADLRQLGLFAGTGEAWRTLRVEAERAARETATGEEVLLSDVFDGLAARLGWTAEQKARAMDAELEREFASVRPIALTAERMAAARQRGERVVMISDTYFPADFVLRLLHRCGYDVDDAALFASSELGFTKRTGSLFAHVAAQLAVDPRTITHTGDNHEADVRSAKRYGIDARYFAEQEPNRYETLFYAGEAQPALFRSAFAGCSRAARLGRRLDGGRQTLWDTSANVIGPVLFGYVLWVVLEAQRRGLRRLYFLARDGQVLLLIAKRIVAWLGLPIDCVYLYASREALFLASITSLDETARSWLPEIMSGKTVRAMLGRIDLEPDEVADRLTGHGIDARDADRRLDPGERARLIELFVTDDSLRDKLLSRAAARRVLLVDYLRQEGFGDGTPLAIVDLGWKGRLQLALARTLQSEPDLAGAVPLTGFYFGLSVAPPDAGTLLTYADVGRGMNAVLLETFCAADHGSTKGYRRDASGRVEPVLVEDKNRAALDWGLEIMQEAVARFTTLLAECLDPADLDVAQFADFARHASLAAFKLFVQQPLPAEAAVFGAFKHAEGQAHTAETQLAPAFSSDERLRWLLRPRSATTVQSFWPEGSFARSSGAATSVRVSLALWKLRGDLSDMRKLVAQ